MVRSLMLRFSPFTDFFNDKMRVLGLMSVEQCRSMQVRRKNKSANQSSSSSASSTPIVSSSGHPIPGTAPGVLLSASAAPGHQPGMPPTAVDANGLPVFVVQPMMGRGSTAHVPSQTNYRQPGDQGELKFNLIDLGLRLRKY